MSFIKTSVSKYPYRIIGEDYQRPVYDGQAVVVLKTKNGRRREGVASLLLMLPTLDQLFCPRDIEFLYSAAKRAEYRKANMMRKIKPPRVEKKTPKLKVYINLAFCERNKF